jgi:hypothetical protein
LPLTPLRRELQMELPRDGDEYIEFDRYQESVRRHKRAIRNQAIRRMFVKWVAILTGTTAAIFVVLALSVPPNDPRTWAWETRLRHVLAAPGCDAARAVGLAPAYRGFPGYWARLDRDNDGIACEPRRRR